MKEDSIRCTGLTETGERYSAYVNPPQEPSDPLSKVVDEAVRDYHPGGVTRREIVCLCLERGYRYADSVHTIMNLVGGGWLAVVEKDGSDPMRDLIGFGKKATEWTVDSPVGYDDEQGDPREWIKKTDELNEGAAPTPEQREAVEKAVSGIAACIAGKSATGKYVVKDSIKLTLLLRPEVFERIQAVADEERCKPRVWAEMAVRDALDVREHILKTMREKDSSREAEE